PRGIPHRGRPPGRRGDHLRSRRRMRALRPPLQPAVHAAARRTRADAREHVSLQHDPRHGCPGARCARGEESVRDLAMDDMYRDYILDHYKNPRNFGELEGATHTYHDSNPLCGDEMTMQLKIDDGHVDDVHFTGKGCAISQA